MVTAILILALFCSALIAAGFRFNAWLRTKASDRARNILTLLLLCLFGVGSFFVFHWRAASVVVIIAIACVTADFVTRKGGSSLVP